MNQDRAPIAPPDNTRRQHPLPWILLVLVVFGLAGTLWWGYQKRATVAQYAMTSLLDQQVANLVPEGVDAQKLIMRVAALLKAVNSGRIDADRLNGMGTMFRSYYDDKKLDRDELESLLAFAEAAVTP